MIGSFRNWHTFLSTFVATILVAASPLAAADDQSNLPEELDKAPIALLVDISSGQVLYSRNPDRRFVPASITKAMTTFVAFELMQEGTLRQTQTLRVSPEAWREWNGQGSTMWLDAESTVRVEDLLTGIATVSANDASIVLAEGAAGSVAQWVELMNAEAREIGMNSSRFGTPNGWPDDGYTFTTANDLVKLAETMIARHPKKFAHYVGRPEFFWNGITQPNHDPIIGRVQGADGIKTGYTNEAGHGFLGTAERDGQRLVMVLGAMDGYGARTRVSRQLMEWGFAGFDRPSLFDSGQTIGTARVQNGTSRKVALVANGPVRVNVPKGRTGELAMTIRYDGPIRAPIAAGQEVAILEVTVPGMEPARIPLVAASTVDRAGFFSRFWNGMAGWFS